MRTLARNKQKMKYSQKGERQPIYLLDEEGNKIVDYVDSEGNFYYKETGSYTSGWTEPKEFLGNIAMSGGEAEAMEFGLSLGDYNAVIVMNKGEIPLKEKDVIWLNSEVLWENKETRDPDEKSADFEVLKVSESLNFVKYVLKAVIK